MIELAVDGGDAASPDPRQCLPAIVLTVDVDQRMWSWLVAILQSGPANDNTVTGMMMSIKVFDTDIVIVVHGNAVRSELAAGVAVGASND
jgi:hypothetical protein